MDVISETQPKARKEYWCDACRCFANAGLGESDMEPGDWQIYQLAKLDGEKILKGQQHRKCVYSDGGELVTYRGRLDMDQLCSKHDVWDD